MSRPKRKVEKSFKVFCEGDTEYNYFEYIRKTKKASLAIKPVNMKGGGYANFLNRLKEDANSNCLAKFIIIDGDRAEKIPGEREVLWQIINYCKLQNDSKRIPHILIIDFPDFEYVACLHTFSYKGQNVEQYLKNELGYSNIDEFKADKDVFKVLVESGKGSISQLISVTEGCTSIVNNKFIFNKSKYEIQVDTTLNKEKLGIRSTNFSEFYEVLQSLDVMNC